MQLIRSIVFSARYRENEPAIAFPGGIATYGALMKATGAAVEALRAFGGAEGAAVMLDIRNPIHHTAMYFALALLGVPSASVGTTFSAQRAGFQPPLLFTDRDDALASGIRIVRVDERWFASDPGARPDYAGLLALPGFAHGDDVVRYVYSSGTTGHPKCVALTQACLERRMFYSRIRMPWWMHGPAALNMLGFSTIAGTTTPLVAHGAGTLLCYAGSMAETVQMLSLFRVSTLMLAVGQLRSFYAVFGAQPPPNSLKMLSVVGARVPRRLLADARAKLCDTVTLGYASTEMGSITSGLGTTADVPEGYAGHVLPWVEVEVVDEARRVLPRGSEGMLRVRTPELASYANAEGRAVSALEDGWFYPGDVGRFDEDGALLITGRQDEVINRGGTIVAPEAVEEVLRLDPRIAEVAVVGIVNADGFEEIWAAVVSAGPIDEAEIIEAARPRLNEKVPDRVVRVTAIPRAESEKVRRGALRELLLARDAPMPE